jgi:hypothetical protein
MPASGGVIDGRVRMVAPTVDPGTRNGLVYVDLPAPAAAPRPACSRAASSKSAAAAALTLPHRRGVLRDGFSLRLRGRCRQPRAQRKVDTGRRDGERVAITAGLDPARAWWPAAAASWPTATRCAWCSGAVPPAARKRTAPRQGAPWPDERLAWCIRNPIPSVLLFVMLTLAGLLGFQR